MKDVVTVFAVSSANPRTTQVQQHFSTIYEDHAVQFARGIHASTKGRVLPDIIATDRRPVDHTLTKKKAKK